MIIYAETRGRFLEDVDRNRLERRLIDGFERQTGGVPADRGVWADERHFVARVLGKSMEPLIPDGSYCLFNRDVAGSRGGRVLLVQHQGIADPETGGTYTVKEYRSLKVRSDDPADGPWTHTAIRLVPRNKAFPQVWIDPDHAEELRVIAEFVAVLDG